MQPTLPALPKATSPVSMACSRFRPEVNSAQLDLDAQGLEAPFEDLELAPHQRNARLLVAQGQRRALESAGAPRAMAVARVAAPAALAH